MAAAVGSASGHGVFLAAERPGGVSPAQAVAPNGVGVPPAPAMVSAAPPPPTSAPAGGIHSTWRELVRQGQLVSAGTAAPNWEKSVRSLISPSMGGLPVGPAGVVAPPWGAVASDASSVAATVGSSIASSVGAPSAARSVSVSVPSHNGRRPSPEELTHQHEQGDGSGRVRPRERASVPPDAEVVEVSLAGHECMLGLGRRPRRPVRPRRSVPRGRMSVRPPPLGARIVFEFEPSGELRNLTSPPPCAGHITETLGDLGGERLAGAFFDHSGARTGHLRVAHDAGRRCFRESLVRELRCIVGQTPAKKYLRLSPGRIRSGPSPRCDKPFGCSRFKPRVTEEVRTPP